MPIVIPTPDEVNRMSARDKDKWRKRLGIVMRDVQQTKVLLSTGDVIRSQAQVWMSIYGPDPDWREHQAALLEAMK